jgi:uncharacterized membrane protein YeaQ/YmgE (transglycosylase-associated protein family)
MSPLIWYILIGLAAGWLAGQFFKGGKYGVFGDILVGVIGAVIGGFLFLAIAVSAKSELPESLITATMGAVGLLLVSRQLLRT